MTLKLNRWSRRSFKWELDILEDKDYNSPNVEIMQVTNPSMVYSLMAEGAFAPFGKPLQRTHVMVPL